MSSETGLLRKILLQALSGRGAHVLVEHALEGLDWQLSGKRPEGVPHSIFQIVNHMIYWQDFSLQWLNGKKPPTPEHAAEGWPGDEGPGTAQEWSKTLNRFQQGLVGFSRWVESEELFIDRGSGKTALEIIQMIATHNSYHTGQIASLRRLLGDWPPPSGGATW